LDKRQDNQPAAASAIVVAFEVAAFAVEAAVSAAEVASASVAEVELDAVVAPEIRDEMIIHSIRMKEEINKLISDCC